MEKHLEHQVIIIFHHLFPFLPHRLPMGYIISKLLPQKTKKKKKKAKQNTKAFPCRRCNETCTKQYLNLKNSMNYKNKYINAMFGCKRFEYGFGF